MPSINGKYTRITLNGNRKWKQLQKVLNARRNKLPTWNPLAQVVALFVHTYENDVLNEMITFILRKFLQRKLINVNVISYRYNTNIVQTHTWYPYECDNCADDVVNVHLVEECVYSDETPHAPTFNVIETLKPKIPINLHGCELRIAASVIEPFVFYDAENDAFDIGTEVLMTRTIAQALKMQPKFMRINATRENRLVSNETGIYSLLLNGYDTRQSPSTHSNNKNS